MPPVRSTGGFCGITLHLPETSFYRQRMAAPLSWRGTAGIIASLSGAGLRSDSEAVPLCLAVPENFTVPGQGRKGFLFCRKFESLEVCCPGQRVGFPDRFKNKPPGL